MKRIIKSERKAMTAKEYTQYALGVAADYGRSVPFWIRDGDSEQAARMARLAAHWALKFIAQ